MPNAKQLQESISKLDKTLCLEEIPEIKALPRILKKSENIERITFGVYNEKRGILIATEERVLFAHKPVFLGPYFKAIPYNLIKSIESKIGYNLGDLIITTAKEDININFIDKVQLKDFVEHLNSKITHKD